MDLLRSGSCWVVCWVCNIVLTGKRVLEVTLKRKMMLSNLKKRLVHSIHRLQSVQTEYSCIFSKSLSPKFSLTDDTVRSKGVAQRNGVSAP